MEEFMVCIGGRGSGKSALRRLIEEGEYLYKETEQEEMDRMSKAFKEISNRLEADRLTSIAFDMEVYPSTFEDLAELATNEKEIFLDISTLKKRIKHCKNHMEKQKLQRELNELYKAQKRKGR